MESFPEPPAYDRTTARETVACALARVQAMGIELSVEVVLLYELYADGDLTPAQLRAALLKHQDSLPKLW
jgi:hypothetical protein